MKILVIDDTKKHLDSASQTLVGHELTLCSTHDEADKLLRRGYNEDEVVPYWDVVLCDLLMPAGSMAQGGEGEKYVGQEMAVGWSLALRAAKEGAKYVAVVTDMNHHHHPASAMLDSMNGHFFKVDKATVLMTNYVGKVGIKGTEMECNKCKGAGIKKRDDNSIYACVWCEDGIAYEEKGKDWSKILNQLLEN